MPKKKKIGKCIYCLKDKRVTDDHIPPKTLFPRRGDKSLVKVPSCRGCNGGWSKDDEYLRDVVASSVEVEGQEKAKPVVDSFWRSIKKPEKRRFRRYLLNRVRNVPFHSAGGIYLGHRPALLVDQIRVERVLARIVRGIFYYEVGEPLPLECESFGHLAQRHEVAPILDRLNMNIRNMPPARIFQDGAFRYKFLQDSVDPMRTILIAQFFETLWFFGHTESSDQLRQEIA